MQNQSILNFLNSKNYKSKYVKISSGLGAIQASQFSQIAKKLKDYECIEDLTFQFIYSPFESQNVQEICQQIKKMRHLRKLNLSFLNTEITNEVLYQFADALNDSQKIGNLFLNARFEKLTHKGIIALIDSLKNCVDFKHLSLELSETNIDIEGRFLIFSKLKELKNLERLNFYLNLKQDYNDGNNEVIERLGEQLSFNEKLKSLSLSQISKISVFLLKQRKPKNNINGFKKVFPLLS